MLETENKKLRQAEFTKQHTLSQEQLKQLLDGKIERARLYYNASQIKREATASCR